jgi:hypothetical protein
MILFVHSDGSRLGVLEYLGSKGDEDKPPTNGLVHVISTRADVVTSSACETEWAVIFKACKESLEDAAAAG